VCTGFRTRLGAALAATPSLLAWLLCRRGRRRIDLALFVLILPNAPHALTDVIHLKRRIRLQPFLPSWVVIFVVLPLFGGYVLFRLLSCIVSLRLLGGSLRRNGQGRMTWRLDALSNPASAAGVYLAQAARLNSWDALATSLRGRGGARGIYDE
jgi:uncharacterized membrane protein